MLMRIPKGWEMKDRMATPESVFRQRRSLLQALGFVGMGGGLASPLPAAGTTTRGGTALEPPSRNPRFTLDRPLTEEAVAARHNIFDELSTERDKVLEAASRFRTDPWKVHVGGQVKQARTFEVKDLVRLLGLEERLYRHRCVEAWAMAVPWTGFPMRKLVELVEPLPKARFVRLVSAARPDEMPAFYSSRRVFPYYEALSMEEATNELAFLATGIYGRPLPPQHGAPLRLVVPWKYGFKSAKAVVALQFTALRPGTFWNELSPDKYGFVANVDPTETVPWPQSHETLLGTQERRATLPFNGYGEHVAALYGP
jgi:sulfoxide reductase catalytic subunit YedY